MRGELEHTHTRSCPSNSRYVCGSAFDIETIVSTHPPGKPVENFYDSVDLPLCFAHTKTFICKHRNFVTSSAENVASAGNRIPDAPPIYLL